MDKGVNRGILMMVSFLTLVASGIGFATRANAGSYWESEFGIGGTEFGYIMGAGFLGFGIMIFFGGILTEFFGYKKLLMIAFFFHLVSGAMLFSADPLFEMWREADPESATRNVFLLLYASAFLFSICQGLYEAVINPLIADIYPDNKTHYLNILHAGWPGGMIIGGLIGVCFMGEKAWITDLSWKIPMALFMVPVLIYGLIAIPQKFPATVAEKGSDFGKVFSCFASPVFLVLLVLHGLVGYMELGADSWMPKLMQNLMNNSILILVYTSLLMFVLRFFAGPLVHKLNPIGLLFASSVIACLGLLWLGSPIENVAMIFIAATFYSLGKAFLWPTMLAVAGERYPQCGSVAMGALGAAGMIIVGQIGNPRIGAQQGFEMSKELERTSAETFNRYAEKDTTTEWWMQYRPIDKPKLAAANGINIPESKKAEDIKKALKPISDAKLIAEKEKKELLEHYKTDVPAVKAAYIHGGQRALTLTAMVPAAMAIGFLGLLIYYRSIGGYKVIKLDQKEPKDE